MVDANNILKNKDKKRAKEKILLINEILDENDSFFHGFLGGSIGLLYYYYHVQKVLPNDEIFQRAENLLAKVFEDINNTGVGIKGALFGNGAAGFAYTVNYLQQNGFVDFDIEEEFNELDTYLFNTAQELIAKDEIDYLHGALGIIHYFTTRAKESIVIKNYINILTSELLVRAIPDKNGIWFRNYSVDHLRGNSIVDFGLAHGLVGMLLILIKAWEFLNNKEKVEDIIRNGINFILANQMPIDKEKNEYSNFPCTLNNDSNVLKRLNRLAWCYGDINQTLLLYRAGKLLGDRNYTAKADSIGFKTIERKSEESTFCNDSHFCHGTAGLAQFYKCLFKESGHYKYFQTYEYWINYTLKNIDREIEMKAYSSNPTSLLEGWSGVGLVLAEYLNDGEDLNWAKAFLL